jgi:hypothetical protein
MAGTPRCIPKLSVITDNPSPRTLLSEFAFSISDSDEIIGVRPTFTTSLNYGRGFAQSHFHVLPVLAKALSESTQKGHYSDAEGIIEL